MNNKQQKGGKRPHILVAEDNIISQKLMVRILKKQGYSVEVAKNGEEAIEAMEKQSFDLVLMDVHMPIMGGIEATRIIRESDGTIFDPHIPIIAVTAQASDNNRQFCLEAGMNNCFYKSFKEQDLFEEIEKLVSVEVCASEADNN